VVLKLGHFGSRSGITESFEMWWWRRMEMISWMGGVKNEEVLESRRKGISCTIYCILLEDWRLTGMATACIGTAF
jgi:hypothetical protein